uniref:Neelaredoxin n=1 Tax=Desulfobacca acetoxidans TaxID=60893 RepID=A0A7V6A5F9_9BACT
MKIGDVVQSADWKAEKHVPVIEGPDAVGAEEIFEVKVAIGKEIAHPNTTEHHIRWISVFFKPDGDKFAYQVAHCEFAAHGESVEGPNKGPVYTHHGVTVSLKINKPGTILASSLCNIHGLWENAKTISIK